MAYDEGLAQRVREIVSVRPGVDERKMFGGLAWMIGGHMACVVMGEDLVVRIGADAVDAALEESHTSTFGREGAKPMRGFVHIDAAGLTEDSELARWVDEGADHAASLPPK